jgi:hypothetical protein
MLTVSTLYRYASHNDCDFLHVMAAAEDELKARLLESYVTARNIFFHWTAKWFYRDPSVPEVCDCILYAGYKFS